MPVSKDRCTEVVELDGHSIYLSTETKPDILQYNWKLNRSLANKGYFYYRAMVIHNGVRVRMSLHQYLRRSDLYEGAYVDHINGNTSDYRLCNLRICSHAENTTNRKKIMVSNTSGYKGVSAYKTKNKIMYEVHIRHNKVPYYLGRYTSAEEAAHAYDNVCIYLNWEFASINFPHTPFDMEYAKSIISRFHSGKRITNTSGVSGVTIKRDRIGDVFIARATVNGVRHNIGSFRSLFAAEEAIIKFKEMSNDK
jgi:hypothetical protein